MKMLKALRIFGAVLAAAGLIGVGAGFFATSSMIVAFGVHTLSAISGLSFGLLGAGAAMIIGGTVPAAVNSFKTQNNNRLLESEREKKQQRFNEYTKDSLNPVNTRARFEQLRENNAHLDALVDLCVRQMDRMDTYQERHKTLLDANEAIYLEDTIEVIDESERRMCRNFRNIINCCILIEHTNSGTEELDRDIINKALADNEEELASVSTLMKYSVAYINNYNRNGVKDRSELDAWLKIMKASTGESNEAF